MEYCDKCKIIIEKKVYDYSKEKLKRALCYRCQHGKRQSTPQCIRLFNELKTLGCKVAIEKWDKHKHIDIAIPSSRLNIEVDGKQHNTDRNQAISDLQRTFYSLKEGYVTIRIPNVLVSEETIKDTAKCLRDLVEEYDSIKRKNHLLKK
ncbi:MAG TPA: DUF559 domain-containing protein [Candidatus Nanoarchaeia archaeon]|nr:DUF559 domain-containing protein [Candidatus Nanoarchaeia archaeon]